MNPIANTNAVNAVKPGGVQWTLVQTDGWTIYLWLVAGALILIAVVYWMRWGLKNEQFDEDIKYVVFSEDDKDKMTPEEFAKAREVMQKQMESRERHLAQQAAQRQSSANKA